MKWFRKRYRIKVVGEGKTSTSYYPQWGYFGVYLRYLKYSESYGVAIPVYFNTEEMARRFLDEQTTEKKVRFINL